MVKNPILSVFRGPNPNFFLKLSDFPLSILSSLHPFINDSHQMFPIIMEPIQIDFNFVVVLLAHSTLTILRLAFNLTLSSITFDLGNFIPNISKRLTRVLNLSSTNKKWCMMHYLSWVMFLRLASSPSSCYFFFVQSSDVSFLSQIASQSCSSGLQCIRDL